MMVLIYFYIKAYVLLKKMLEKDQKSKLTQFKQLITPFLA